jgi:YndJ-like protein
MSSSNLRNQLLWGALLCLLVVFSIGFAPLSFNWPLGLISVGAFIVVPCLCAQLKIEDPLSLVNLPHWHWFATLSLAPALILPPGMIAGGLTVPWLGETIFISLHALQSLRRSRSELARVTSLLGPLQLVIGGAWLLADRFDWTPLGFEQPIIRLTAAHFHFAAFALPCFAGWTLSAWQRLRPTSKPSKRRALDDLLKLGVLGVSGGVLLVAGGITMTKLGGNIAFECLLAASFSVATLVVALAQSLLGWRLKNYWLLVSGISLTAGMSLALFYALRLWLPLPWLHIPLMWALHGSLQVFGYTLCGCIGWFQTSATQAPAQTIDS